MALPEGSSDIQHDSPYPVTVARSKRFSYLDIIGRPVLTLTGKNLVAVTADDLTITYSLPSLNLLLEPGLLVAAFLAFFGVVVVSSRLDLSLTTAKSGHGHNGNEAARAPADTTAAFSSLLAGGSQR